MTSHGDSETQRRRERASGDADHERQRRFFPVPRRNLPAPNGRKVQRGHDHRAAVLVVTAGATFAHHDRRGAVEPRCSDCWWFRFPRPIESARIERQLISVRLEISSIETVPPAVLVQRTKRPSDPYHNIPRASTAWCGTGGMNRAGFDDAVVGHAGCAATPGGTTKAKRSKIVRIEWSSRLIIGVRSLCL